MQRAISDPVFQAFCDSVSVNSLRTNPLETIAVALSGGPDSMALLHLLTRLDLQTELHALTVDHGLRDNSADEARQVGEWVKDWPRVRYHVLTWDGDKPESAIIEAAREARYKLMMQWCFSPIFSPSPPRGEGWDEGAPQAEHSNSQRQENPEGPPHRNRGGPNPLPGGERGSARGRIKQLWLGHNRTDQAETFLFRLAKGSGLDGLGGMREMQSYKDTGLTLHRPLLNISKADLQQYCSDHAIPHVQDPTNANLKYARTRLRQSLPILEEEGLSEKRLAVTAARLARARDALEQITQQALQGNVTTGAYGVAITMTALINAPSEIRLRMIRTVLATMTPEGYGPRLEILEEKIEACFADLHNARRFTLGGFVFFYDDKEDCYRISREIT